MKPLDDPSTLPSPSPRPATLAAALRLAADELQAQTPPPELQTRVLAAMQAAAAATAVTPTAIAPSAESTAPAAKADPAGRRADARTAPSHTPAGLAAGTSPAPTGRPREPVRSGWWAWSGALACAAVLAGSALLMLRVPASSSFDDGVRIAGLGGDFLPLVPPERWPREAAPAWLVSTELPSERLAALGLPYDPARAGDSVRAELLLHPSGEVLAVRFLH